jgi:hypothetical protein
MEKRTKDDPWQLKTPPGTSGYTMHVDRKDGRDVLVCTVGKTVLFYDLRCIDDLHAMLKKHGDWMDLGGADEQKPAKGVPWKPGDAASRTPLKAGTD